MTRANRIKELNKINQETNELLKGFFNKEDFNINGEIIKVKGNEKRILEGILAKQYQEIKELANIN